MNKKYLLRSVMTAVCMSSVAVLVGCSDDDKNKHVDIVAPTPPAEIAAGTVVTVIDAKTKRPFAGELTLTVSDASVKDASGKSGPFTVSAGNITLVPGTDDAVTVTAQAGTHFSSSQTVAMTATELTTTEITLSPKEAAADSPIQTTEVAVTVSDTGALTEDVMVKTVVGAEADEKVAAGTSVEVVISKDTIVTDASDKPVTGALTMNVGYFSNDANNAAPAGESPLNEFPGGLDNVQFSVSGTPPTGDTDEGGTFTSAGLIAVEITNADGDKVTNFSTPITVSSSVSADTINPESATGEKIKTGDKMPVWSYEETSGKWQHESDALIGAYSSADNTFAVTFEASHLSYWNLDWYSTATCTSVSAAITDVNGAAITTKLDVNIVRVGGGWSKSSSIVDSKLELLFAPENVAMQLTLTDIDGTVVYSEDVANLCELTAIKTEYGQPVAAEVSFKTQLVCSNTSAVEPVATPSLLELYAADVYVGQKYLSSTGADYSLESGKEYIAKTYAYDVDGVVLPESGVATTPFTAADGESVTVDYSVECAEAPTGATSI